MKQIPKAENYTKHKFIDSNGDEKVDWSYYHADVHTWMEEAEQRIKELEDEVKRLLKIESRYNIHHRLRS